MGRKPRVERTPEDKWQIVQEGINISSDFGRISPSPQRCSDDKSRTRTAIMVFASARGQKPAGSQLRNDRADDWRGSGRFLVVRSVSSFGAAEAMICRC